MSNKKTKREAKASVFEDLFSDKENLLALYKTLHPEDKNTTIDDLKYVSLKNIITTGQYNDLGFMVGLKLIILVEAQSTWSVNIILRCFLYLAETWNRYFISEKYDLYGSKPVEIPEPELYVIYTGNKQINKHSISLSEEFFNGKKVSIEVTVKVLQYSGDTDIINQYIFFCKTLDEQRRNNPDNSLAAVKEAIRICLDKNILNAYLQERSKEVVDIMLSLYSQEQATNMMLENAKKETAIKVAKETAIKVAKETAIKVAKETAIKVAKETAVNLYSMHMDVEIIAKAVNYPVETVKDWCENSK